MHECGGSIWRVTGRSCLHGWLAATYSHPRHLSFVPPRTHSALRHADTHDTPRKAVSSKTTRQVTTQNKEHIGSLRLPDMHACVCVFFTSRPSWPEQILGVRVNAKLDFLSWANRGKGAARLHLGPAER